MSIPYEFLPTPWLRAADVAFVAALAVCALSAPWERLREEMHQHVLFGACLAVTLLWKLEAGVQPGLQLHLLGASALTLLVGPQFALLALAVLLSGYGIAQGEWQSIGVNGLLCAAVPVGTCAAVLRLAKRYLPQHVFAYIFANGYFGAALSMLASAAVVLALLAATGAYRSDYLLTEYVPFLFMLSWSEAFLTGLVITLLVMERPRWVETYENRAAR